MQTCVPERRADEFCRKKAKAATETCGEGREVWFAAREEKRILRRNDFCGAESDKKI